MTDTQLLDAQATHRRASVGWVASWLGCSPTGMRATTRSVFGSRARTVRPAQSDTNSWARLRARATAYGRPPHGTAGPAAPDVPSTARIVPWLMLSANSVS